MISIKSSKMRLVKAIFGCFFGILGLILPIFANNTVYADTIDGNTPAVTETVTETETTTEATTEDTADTTKELKEPKKCNDSLGSIGWLVCPTTGKITEAVDWLYEKNRDFLEINPVRAEEGTAIFEVWNYFLGVANIAFVIFLLIVIYSQITGVGISNYGIKKALPKLIIAAIMVNLSFTLCSLAVDASNIVGNGLRGVFNGISENVALTENINMLNPDSPEAKIAMGDLYGVLGDTASTGGLAALFAFEGGEIWMLIPAALAALVAVVVGLITIALRQVVVILLIMIAPLAIVAYILPNTEKWFTKWKDLLIKMLVFYPMYSLLFGAASLAGWAIIASAHDGFGLTVGILVQILPLFFSWSLMKMSGTFLGTVNAKLTGLFSAPLAANRAWAESHRELTRQKFLASENVYTPTLKLRQFLSDRKIAREEEIKENAGLVKQRGLYYATKLNYKPDGSISKEGREAYSRLIRNRKYQNYIDNSKADFDKGLGSIEATRRSKDLKMRSELEALDIEAMNAFDEAEIISARAEMIDYNIKKSRQERFNAAMNAHMDDVNGSYLARNSAGQISARNRADYKFHMQKGSAEYNDAIARYNKMASIMEGDVHDTQYALASATNSYDVAKKVYDSKFQKLFDYTVPTRDVEYRLSELSKHADALKNVDAIIAGMRVLNQRGDTDLVKHQLDNVLEHGVQLGTHVSQALASFLMFEVKDNDPFLRRFGKYINLETANVYNKNNRQEMNVTYDEYVKGYHVEPNGQKMYAKKDMNKLVEGTSLDNVERTAFSNLDDSLKKAYGWNGHEWTTGEEGFKAYLNKRSTLQTAMEPAFLSASLKWLSGSEQMNSAVKFWTGYELKQKKDENGNNMVDEHNEPIYELSSVWDNDDAFKGNADYAKKYFQDKSMAYIRDQTTSQILNMRTDYRDPLVKHLVEEYCDKHDGFKAEYDAKIKELNAAHYDDDAKKNNEARQKAVSKYERMVAGKQLRDILGKTGKLEQIFNMKRSGATANMKDWLRSMTLLDDPDAMKIEVDKYSKIRKEENKDDGDRGDDVPHGNPAYDEATRSYFANEIDKLWDDNRDNDDYYDLSVEKLNQLLGPGDHIIKRKYEEYRNSHPGADNHDLREFLQDLLKDPSNY